MTDQLTIYNSALRLLGERKITLVEQREPRYLLDDVWDNNGLKRCLEMGSWNFAIKEVALEYDSSIEPEFGFTRAFEKPSDWVRTAGVYGSGEMKIPLIYYKDCGGFWSSDLDTLYLRYVSDDESYGMDLSLWPESFTALVEHFFAKEICFSLTKNANMREELRKEFKKRLIEAKSKDAHGEAPAFRPPSSWITSRLGARDENVNEIP